MQIYLVILTEKYGDFMEDMFLCSRTAAEDASDTPHQRVRKRTETSYKQMVVREAERREKAREKEKLRKKRERERRRKYIRNAEYKIGKMMYDFYATRGVDDPDAVLARVAADLARAGGAK